MPDRLMKRFEKAGKVRNCDFKKDLTFVMNWTMICFRFWSLMQMIFEAKEALSSPS
jgi:hypothetical protein